MKKAIAVIKKDLKEISQTFQIFGVMIILPILFGVVYPLIVFFISSAIPPEEATSLGFIVNLFNGFFLIMAVTIPVVVASDSFAGEKERKTIEALLAAPISDEELFIGKVLVSFIPAVLLTYLSAAIYCIIIDVGFGAFILPDLPFLFMLVLIPIFTLLSIELTVFISVRVKGFREAQQLAGVIIIPVLVLVMLNAFNISVFLFP
ncbi:MAG: ABC transporter permease subunit [Candidatus Helarchaeota archaeon]